MNIVFAIPGFQTDTYSAEGRAVRAAVKWCADKVGKAKFKPGAVVFSIDKAFLPRASNHVNATALECLLSCLTALDTIWLKRHGRFHVPLYETPIYYERTLVWDTIPALYRRGFGDCKSLSACVVAEHRAKGRWCRPVFRHKSRVHSTMYHILVMFQNGTWEDPSKALGMTSYQEEPGGMSRHTHRSPGFGFEV